MKLRNVVAAVLSSLIFTFTVLAQVSINGSLRGRISDPTAAGLTGVSLTLTNTATATTQKANTDSNGEYQFARVTPGIYTLTAEKDGFKRAQRESIVIAVNENAIADLVLMVGQISETVTVEAGATLVQAQSVELSELVNERRIKELPLNGRNLIKLVQLAPGVGNPGSANNPSINGGRAVTNSYVVDGVGSNDERLNTGFVGVNGSNTDLGQNVPNLVSTEAIQEYRIITSNADATFGRGSGGNINLVTKSGGNQWHGSAYEYLRNDALDAADYFYKANPRPQFVTTGGKAKTPPFKQNLYGGTFGGRIIRDRHFFFGSYEGFQQRRLNQTASNVVVPNADLLRFVPGDLGRFFNTFFIDRGITPATGNPAGTFTPLPATERNAIVAAGFPTAFFDGNTANGEAGTVQISAAPPINIEQNAFLVRTDHHLTDKLTANVRYSFARSFVTAGSATPLDTQVAPRQYQSAAIQLNYNLTPAQVLEIRGGVLRNRFQQFTKGGIDQRLQALGVSSQYGILASVGPASAPFFRAAVNGAFIDNQTTPQLSVLHTWQRGNMTWRSGADLRSIHNNVANISSGQPLFEFTNSLVGANGIYGANPQATDTVTVSTRLTSYGGIAGGGTGPTTPMRGYRSRQQEYFVQNDWRVRRDLTLNLGLRYSFFGVWSEVNNALSNLFAVDGAGNVVPDVNPFKYGRTQNRIVRLTDDLRYYNPDCNNFQPRLGFAYDLFGKGRTIVRAGYGWYYDRLIQIQFTAAVGNVPYAISSNTANVPFRLSQALPITAAANPATTAVNPEIENARTERWNVAVEHQLGKDTSVTVAYVGMRTDNLLSQAQPNGFGGFPTAVRPDPRFTTQQLIDNLNLSRYRALQITAKRRFARGLDFTAAYTFGEAKDNNSRDSFTTFPTFLNSAANPAQSGVQGTGANFVARDARADFGLSEFDVRHNLTFTHVLELPIGRGRPLLGDANGFVNALLGGWALNGLAVLRSGEPINVVRGVDFNDDGDATADRPALISGSLNDLYRKGPGEGTQFLVTQADALTRLATPTTIDPTAMIARNALRAPRVMFYDLALLKRFVVKERYNVGFEANFFNVFNRAIFGAPVSNLSNALFGRVTSNLPGTNPRQIQFGLKMSF